MRVLAPVITPVQVIRVVVHAIVLVLVLLVRVLAPVMRLVLVLLVRVLAPVMRLVLVILVRVLALVMIHVVELVRVIQEFVKLVTRVRVRQQVLERHVQTLPIPVIKLVPMLLHVEVGFLHVEKVHNVHFLIHAVGPVLVIPAQVSRLVTVIPMDVIHVILV